MKKQQIYGNFQGEIKVNSIQFKRIEQKRVIRNNKTSGKILTSAQWIGEEVILLFPKRSKSKYKNNMIKRSQLVK